MQTHTCALLSRGQKLMYQCRLLALSMALSLGPGFSWSSFSSSSLLPSQTPRPCPVVLLPVLVIKGTVSCVWATASCSSTWRSSPIPFSPWEIYSFLMPHPKCCLSWEVHSHRSRQVKLLSLSLHPSYLRLFQHWFHLLTRIICVFVHLSP